MENVEKIKPTGLFTNYIFKTIPLAFDESMSYYETLCGLLAYLRDTVIPAVDNNADAIVEVQNKIIELQNYVDHYFDNLDVQEEINNKLDEMAESGQLTDIIAQYLQLAGVLAYDTKTAMKSAENLVAGSIAKTLGTTTYNDGYGYFYKIRDLKNTDVIDELNIIALSDPDLIAERLFNNDIGDKTNPCYYGADPTGTIDSATAINNCINANKGKAIKFTPGKYLVNSSIDTPYYTDEQVNIDFAGSTLYTNASLDYVLGVGTLTHGTDLPNREDFTYTGKSCYSIIENLVIDAPNSTIGILTEQNYWYPRILNTSIFNTIIGIQLGRTAEPRWSSDAAIDNVYIQCKDYKNTSTRCIVINGHDNKITNSRFYNAHVGIQDNKGGNYFINNHIYLYGHFRDKDVPTPEFVAAYPTTIAFLSNGANQNRFESVYFDSYNTAFKSNVSLYCGSFIQCFYGTGVEGYDGVAFDFSQGTLQNLAIENCFIDMNTPSQNGQNYGLKINPSQDMNILYRFLSLRSNETHWLEGDLLNLDMNQHFSQPYGGSKNFTGKTYYKIAYIPLVYQTSIIVGITGGGNPNKQMCRIWTGDGTSLELNQIGTAGTNFYMGAKIVTIKGVKFIELSLMIPSTGWAAYGIYAEVEKSRDCLGIIPVPERVNTTADPSDYTTTPTYTIGFEY